jgi:hypothetical protein
MRPLCIFDVTLSYKIVKKIKKMFKQQMFIHIFAAKIKNYEKINPYNYDSNNNRHTGTGKMEH